MSDDIGQGTVDFRRVDITAFVKRLVRYYELQGNGDWRYAAETIEQQHAEIERLRAENAKLREAVTKCMDRFGEYEREHINAGKYHKAGRNGEMRQMCRDAIPDAPR